MSTSVDHGTSACIVEDAGQLSLYAEVVERQWKTLAGEKAWFRMFFFLL